MIKLDDNVYKLFDDVLQEISKNALHMMEELWLNWTHLGVDEKTKIHNTKKIIQIEKELHCDVVLETRSKLKMMQKEVDKLKEETEELSKCLSINIPILEFRDDMLLNQYKQELEEQIAGFREQVKQRRIQIERLMEWQRDLGDKLGVTIQELPEVPLPSEDDLDRLKHHLDGLQAERDKRIETFLNTQVQIKDIMEKLFVKPQTKFEQLVATSLSVDFKVTDLNMDRLGKLLQDLQEKYQQTNNRVLELRERLAKLWDCLDEDQIYRENFLQAHIGCHPQTEQALKEEIKRCEQIKRQKIQVFIANMRTKIKLMWDNIMYSSQEREQDFLHYYQDIFTEDTLTLHEYYLEKITKFYNDHKPLFDLVITRKNLWMKINELDAKATEPGRYHNRGGQLLKEEKERKTICNALPKIETQIREMVADYEAKYGKPFTVHGKPLLQVIQEDWDARKTTHQDLILSNQQQSLCDRIYENAVTNNVGTYLERHNKVSSARKQALTPNTPLFRSLATSPLGKRNRTAAGLQPSTDKRPPIKRLLITGSAAKATTTTNNLSGFKRSAISTIKRRVSGRLAAREVALDGQRGVVKRKLDYEGNNKKTPKVNGSILKHKRASNGKRRSSSRRSINVTRSTAESANERPSDKDPLMETTMLTTYTDFKDNINEKQISRSSLAQGKNQEIPNIPIIVCEVTTPKKNTTQKAPMTPKIGKENIQHNLFATPNKNIIYTPSRLTRSAVKNNDVFLTPRAPLSASKVNLQRENTIATLSVKTTPNTISRSKTQANIVRARNLPPII